MLPLCHKKPPVMITRIFLLLRPTPRVGDNVIEIFGGSCVEFPPCTSFRALPCIWMNGRRKTSRPTKERRKVHPLGDCLRCPTRKGVQRTCAYKFAHPHFRNGDLVAPAATSASPSIITARCNVATSIPEERRLLDYRLNVASASVALRHRPRRAVEHVS